MSIPLSVEFSPSAGCGVAGAAGDGIDCMQQQSKMFIQFRSSQIIFFVEQKSDKPIDITSASLDALGAGVLGDGDVGSGVLAPLESA